LVPGEIPLAARSLASHHSVMNISPLVGYLVMLVIAVLFSLLLLEIVLIWFS